MEQALNVRELDPESAAWIEREARRRGISVDELLLQVIRRGISSEKERAGLSEFHDLDNLAGTWDESETQEFLHAISDFQKLDEELWP